MCRPVLPESPCQPWTETNGVITGVLLRNAAGYAEALNFQIISKEDDIELEGMVTLAEPWVAAKSGVATSPAGEGARTPRTADEDASGESVALERLQTTALTLDPASRLFDDARSGREPLPVAPPAQSPFTSRRPTAPRQTRTRSRSPRQELGRRVDYGASSGASGRQVLLKPNRDCAAPLTSFNCKSAALPLGEPDLLLVFGGSYLRLHGFPPWQLRLTEM